MNTPTTGKTNSKEAMMLYIEMLKQQGRERTNKPRVESIEYKKSDFYD